MLKKVLFFVLLAMLLSIPSLYNVNTVYGQTSTRELISNNNFRGLQGWTIQEWFNPTGRRGEVFEEPDGIKFKSTSGNTRMGIMQTINADVSNAQQLNLTAVVKAVHQTLDGTGWQGREAPIAIMMSYTDVNGVVHNSLPIMPDEPQTHRMFWHGFYYKDPTGNSKNWHGTKVPQNQFYTFRYNLMNLNPRPKIIHAIGAEGSGWSSREGKINMLSLQYIGAPTPPPPPPQAGNIASFTWIGMTEDKVGQWGRGTPDGTKDGHFNLRLINPPNGVEIQSIAVYSANESGAPAGGQIWHTANTSYWVLGVFQQGRQINSSHVRTLGVFRGDTVFDLYCNDSGWFKPNQNFLVEVIFAGGAKATRVVKLPATPPPPPPPTPQAINIHGAWNCNDGGRYYIRQIGNRIWWFGESSPTNPQWSNVAYGTLTGNELRLEWADVPKGSIMGTGTLLLQVISNNRIEARQKTGGFGGSIWTR